MKRVPKNLAASVRDRLKALAVERVENFDLVLVRYGIERLLYRISQSVLKNQFVLKGAMLFTAWEGFQHRETRDLDLMGFGENSLESLVNAFESICATAVVADGLEFVGVTGEPIRALEEYGGVRLTVLARLTAARITVQVDVGFGNRITPAPKEIKFPTLLDFPAPKLRAYPVETVVAEKLQALVELGLRNGRLKDYFDLWHLGRTVDFNGALLARAIRATFAQRKSAIPEVDPVGLTSRFHDDALRKAAWVAFGKKIDPSNRSLALGEVVVFLREFLIPPLNAAQPTLSGPTPGMLGVLGRSPRHRDRSRVHHQTMVSLGTTYLAQRIWRLHLLIRLVAKSLPMFPTPTLALRRRADTIKSALLEYLPGVVPQSLRACLKIGWGPAARDFGGGQGGEAGASPQWAVTAEPTLATAKRSAARRVFAEKARWLRCSSLTDRWRVCSFVTPRHQAFSAKTGPHRIFKQALSTASARRVMCHKI